MTNIMYPLKMNGIYEETTISSQILPSIISQKAIDGNVPNNAFCRWGLFCWENTSSIIQNGDAKNKTLQEIIEEHGQNFLGTLWKVGTPFPLYLKIIENHLQPHAHIHSDCNVTNFHYHENNKLWYILNSGEKGQIAAGISAIAANKYRFSRERSLVPTENIMQVFTAETSDAYYIPNKRMHQLHGEGLVVWEIGQYPVLPLKFGDSATSQEEHLAALNSINFQDHQIIRICREMDSLSRTKKIKILPYCPYFFIDEIRLIDRICDKVVPSIFSVLAIVEGEITINTNNGFSESFYPGDVCILPACLGEYEIISKTPKAKILQITPNLHGKNN